MEHIFIQKGDLFTSRDSIAHCISNDLKMGAGIALQFRRKFGNISNLKRQKGCVRYLREISGTGSRYIFYLITKERFFHKPMYDSLEKTLIELHTICKRLDISSISIPKLGCGLDKLEWKKVKYMINKIFIGIKVTVYVL